MQKYYKKHDNVHYINKNYVLTHIYNDENECINDTLSAILKLSYGDLSHHMNTRVPSEPRYDLRERHQSQQQQDTILLLIHNFERLAIHEVNKEDLSKILKESVDPKGIIFPLPFIN